ncbi:MAG: ABC transporter ATP-binding protein [Myxococcota bacterium]
MQTVSADAACADPQAANTSGAQPSPQRLLTYVQPYRNRLFLGSALLVLTNALDKAVPWMLQHAVDAFVASDFHTVRTLAIAVVSTAAVMWLVRTASRVVVFNVGRDIEFDLRNALLSKVHTLGASLLVRYSTGEIMSRATNDLAQVRLLVGFGTLNAVNTSLAYGAGLALMASISAELTLYAMLPYPLFILFARSFGRTLFSRSQQAQEALGRLSEVAQENMAAVRLIRAYGAETHEAERFERVNQDLVQKNMRLVVIRSVMWPVLMTIGSIGTLTVLWKGGAMVVQEKLTVGQFAAFNAYLGQLIWPTLSLGWLLSVVGRGRASFARVREILESKPVVPELPNAVEAPSQGDLRVENLSFSYGDREVLHDISFHLHAGETLALVGPTGAGKSTLASLLPRLQDTPKGTVFLGGQDVTALKLRSLRSQVGYVQQEPFLFSSTVARNIAFPLPRECDEERAYLKVRHAAAEAVVCEDIDRLPEGFDTVVGERGVQLSGGQKQRVALARALLNEPAVIVLDDPMSAVDAHTETLILEALEKAGRERTMLLITNRVAAASKADHIVVIDAGSVVESGRHQELIRNDGVYAKLAGQQALEEELAGL